MLPKTSVRFTEVSIAYITVTVYILYPISSEMELAADKMAPDIIDRKRNLNNLALLKINPKDSRISE